MGKSTLVRYLTFSLAILCGVHAAPCVQIIGQSGTKNFYSASKDQTWFEALEYCHCIGMKMATIQNEEENDVVSKYLRTKTNKHLWIAATDIFSEGNFHWITNSHAVNFSNWLNGKPAGGRHRNCVLINGVTTRWEDQLCTFKFSQPLCELTS